MVLNPWAHGLGASEGRQPMPHAPVPTCTWSCTHTASPRPRTALLERPDTYICMHSPAETRLVHQLLQLLLHLQHGVGGLHMQEVGGLAALDAHVHGLGARARERASAHTKTGQKWDFPLN